MQMPRGRTPGRGDVKVQTGCKTGLARFCNRKEASMAGAN